MADAAPLAAKRPWHLWVVGIVSLLWNVVGVVDFTLTQAGNETYLKDFTPEQVAYFKSFPLWSLVAWGGGVYGGFLGSVLLVLRRRWAMPVFAISIVGVILTSLYSHVITDGGKIMGGGNGAAIFSAVIFVIAVLLWLYARAMAKRGVLR